MADSKDHKAAAVAYIDNEGSVIIVGYEAYRKTSWIDGDDRAIPASWKKLEVVDNAPGKPTAANEPNEG